MKRQLRQSVEPSYDPELLEKQQLLCQTVQEELQVLQSTIQLYVSRMIKEHGYKLGKSCDRNYQLPITHHQ